MFTTVQQGFKVYKKEVALYMVKMARLIKATGSGPEGWGGSNERDMQRCSANLDGMAKALGITEKQHLKNLVDMRKRIEHFEGEL